MKPLSETEKKYVQDFIGLLSLQTIAKALRRDKSVVSAYAREVKEERLKALTDQQKPARKERITEEGYTVYDHDLVYEVVWERYNAEYSEAVVEGRMVHQIPEKYPIWISQTRCQKRCNELNAQKPTILS